MAQVLIKNKSDIIKIFEARVSLALQKTQDIIYNAIMEELSNYYHEPVFKGSSTPKQYDRLYKLLNSVVKTKINKTGNSFSCSVEVDDNYLNYTYPGGATGQEVWEWANDKTHGGTIEGKLEIWNNAIDSIGGKQGIIDLMKQNLKKCGVFVK